MKILQAMAGAEFGGAEEFFVRLAIALNGLDLQQRVVIQENKTRARRLRAAVSSRPSCASVECWM